MSWFKKILMYNSVTYKMCHEVLKFKNKLKKKSSIFIKNSKKITEIIHDVFEKNNLNYFYNFGNLLGIIREGHFLEHDDDIDIGIVLDEKLSVKEIVGLLEQKDFKLVSYYEFRGEIRECNFLINGVTVDLFFYKQNGNSLETYSYLIFPKIKYSCENQKSVRLSKIEYIKEFEYREIEGVPLRIPKNNKKILEQEYGKGWVREDKKFTVEKVKCPIMQDFAIKRFVKDGYKI